MNEAIKRNKIKVVCEYIKKIKMFSRNIQKLVI